MSVTELTENIFDQHSSVQIVIDQVGMEFLRGPLIISLHFIPNHCIKCEEVQ